MIDRPPPLLATVALVLVAAVAPAAPPAALGGFDEVQRRLAAPVANLRLLDPRPRAEYDKGHLPGAVWVDVKAAETLAGRPGGLADADAWSAWVAPLAVGPESDVLVYDGDRQLAAARVWWLLRYLGFDRVGLVDGNIKLWASEGRPVSTEPARVEPRPARITFRPDRHATRPEVLAALAGQGARVVDARTEGEYTGAQARSKRGGHIPTACRIEWTDLVRPDGRFLDEPALRARVDRAGLRPGEPVITHCQGGGRASVDAFVFERFGFPTKNYYLGWSDWGNADETPVAVGNEPGAASKGP